MDLKFSLFVIVIVSIQGICGQEGVSCKPCADGNYKCRLDNCSVLGCLNSWDAVQTDCESNCNFNDNTHGCRDGCQNAHNTGYAKCGKDDPNCNSLCDRAYQYCVLFCDVTVPYT